MISKRNILIDLVNHPKHNERMNESNANLHERNPDEQLKIHLTPTSSLVAAHVVNVEHLLRDNKYQQNQGQKVHP